MLPFLASLRKTCISCIYEKLPKLQIPNLKQFVSCRDVRIEAAGNDQISFCSTKANQRYCIFHSLIGGVCILEGGIIPCDFQESSWNIVLQLAYHRETALPVSMFLYSNPDLVSPPEYFLMLLLSLPSCLQLLPEMFFLWASFYFSWNNSSVIFEINLQT